MCDVTHIFLSLTSAEKDAGRSSNTLIMQK